MPTGGGAASPAVASPAASFRVLVRPRRSFRTSSLTWLRSWRKNVAPSLRTHSANGEDFFFDVARPLFVRARDRRGRALFRHASLQPAANDSLHSSSIKFRINAVATLLLFWSEERRGTDGVPGGGLRSTNTLRPAMMKALDVVWVGRGGRRGGDLRHFRVVL